MDLASLHSAYPRLMERAPAVYLTTCGSGGYPHTRAMLNLRNRRQYPDQARLFAGHEADLMVYFTTTTSSGKILELKADPRASAYYCDPARFHGVMLGGDLQIVDDSWLRRALWKAGWECYYPGRPDDPDHTILRLLPTVVTGWHKTSRSAFRP